MPMFKKLKMKIAARRVNNKKSRRGGKSNATKTTVAIKSFFRAHGILFAFHFVQLVVAQTNCGHGYAT